MDFIDIILSRVLTPQGQIESYAATAAKAVEDANAAVAAIEEISDNLATITSTTSDNNTAAAAALEDASAAATLLTGALEDLDGYLSEKINFYGQIDNQTSYVYPQMVVTYPNNHSETINTGLYYKTTGNNNNGTMTQKAITDALNALDASVDSRLNNYTPSGGGGSGSVSLNADPGTIVIVGQNGNIAAGAVTQDDIIRIQILSGAYSDDDVVSLTIDYKNLSVYRNNNNINFNNLKMFGGRKRCIVNDAGTIVAWQGDNNYVEDGSLGQVMVYQPKFYYLRAPLNYESGVITRESISVSNTKKSGFSIHPMFLDSENHELEYVLLPAYEGCAYSVANGTYNLTDAQNVNLTNDKLSSIAGAKPITGTSQAFTVTAAEQMAANRGTGWHLTDLAFESLQQMLMMIEYEAINLQTAFDLGPTNLNNYNNINGACITGSTTSLGSASGRASSTTQTVGATSYNHTTEGKCSISYRGVENPYGNTWRMVGNTEITQDNSGNVKAKYKGAFINLPLATRQDWLSSLGYDANNAWALLPAIAQNSTSAYPFGDFCYGTTITNNEVNGMRMGGIGTYQEQAGPFCFAYDHELTYTRYTSNGRIMHIPTYDSAVYNINITSWQTATGGAFND